MSKFGNTHAMLKELVKRNQSIRDINKRHSHIKAGLGWKPNIPGRHLHLEAHAPTVKVDINAKVSLRSGIRRIIDQYDLGKCTGCMSSEQYEFDEKKQGIKDSFNCSTIFNYGNTRIIEGTYNDDAGATISDAIKALDIYGTVSEEIWPDDNSKFKVMPPPDVYQLARKHRTVKELVVQQTMEGMMGCLQSESLIGLGITVFDSFMDDRVAQTGLVPMPNFQKETSQGGHAINLIGFDPEKVDADGNKGCFEFINSWSENWGDAGFGWLPKNYVFTLASDLRTILVIR